MMTYEHGTVDGARWIVAEIGIKLPSLNDYVNACRGNRYKAAKMKRDIESQVSLFLSKLPTFEGPVFIHFHWVESSKRRDYDNIAFGKKFVLDALVKMGKLKDDNRKYVCGFRDSFEHGATDKVILYIAELEEKQNGNN